jgi:tryptophan-rich sensory protein
MRKLTVFNFVTINGYFKGSKGDISWHRHGAEENEYAAASLKSGNTLLFGRVTYEMMASYWPTPVAIKNDPIVARGMNNADKIVFSRTLKKAEWDNTSNERPQAQAGPETCRNKNVQKWSCPFLLPARGKGVSEYPIRGREEDRMKKALGILVSVLACELAGVIGSVFTMPSIPGWYAGLAKPPFNPPNWVFAPVWTVLYALMGLSAYLVYEKGLRRNEVRKALAVFAGQLLLSTLWSMVFFGAHMIFGAAVVIVLLWGMILASIWLFSRISKAAAYLLVPYILWVSFATVLNISLYVLNR